MKKSLGQLLRSKEWADKISLAKKGHKHSEETKRKIGLKTKERAERTREKRSKSMVGKLVGDKNPMRRPEVAAKLGLVKLGKKRPNITGELNYNWKGGKSSPNEKIRKSTEYKLWRMSVFERDNYTCRFCGIKSIKGNFVLLHADHVKPFNLYPELRFAIDNGRTLCVPCHKTTDTWGSKSKKI